MNRRHFTIALPSLLLMHNALAHHGWSSFDETKPLYFTGKVKSIKWQNPHAEITITMAADAALPADLAARDTPAQTQKVDGPAVMKKAGLPKHRGDWVLELSPLTRIDAWKVPQPKVGDVVEAVAYTFRDEALHDGKHTARVEYYMLGGKLYGLRSMPA